MDKRFNGEEQGIIVNYIKANLNQITRVYSNPLFPKVNLHYQELLEAWRNTDNDDTITDIRFETMAIDSHDAFYVEYVLKKFPDSKTRMIFILLNSRIYSIAEHSVKGGVDEKELKKIVL